MTSPVLKIQDLAVAYKMRGGEVEAVQNVSLAIGRGEAYGLVGESGCGKSSVAWAVLNFLGGNGYIKRGSIWFQGHHLVGKRHEELRRLRGDQIGMVYQDPMQALNPSMRVGDQMMEMLTVHRGLSKGEAQARCVAMLEKVQMPDPTAVLRRYPHQISGGQQQRVVIGMALLNNPALLIMDEPTTALDVTVEAAVLDLIAELRREFETAILFISHNLGVVARVCDKVGVMYAGEMVEQAAVGDLFAHPQHPYTQGLLRCVPRLGGDTPQRPLYPIPGRVPPPEARPSGCIYAPRCDYARQRCIEERPHLRPVGRGTAVVRCHLAEEIDPAQWVSASEVAMVGHEAERVTTAEPILVLNNLHKQYPVVGNSLKEVLGLGPKRVVQAVEQVSLSARRGRVLAIVGESGCGKSTLLKTIIGLEGSTSGEAQLLGFDISGPLHQRDERLIQALQMVFQNPEATLNPAYPVGQQIVRPIHRFRTVAPQKVRGEVIRLLEAVRLGETYYDRLPHQLSGGEKQRVGIARALASRPEVVLCDEPVSALDVSVQAAILNLLLEVQREYGTTLVFVAHDLGVVRFVADEVAVMYLGQVVEMGPAGGMDAPPYHPYTEALLSAVPQPDPAVAPQRIRLVGSVPSALAPPPGCRFHTRCPRRALLPAGGQICTTEAPPWREMGEGHRIFCHLTEAQLRALPPVLP